ncbi:MAG: DNA repair protein RadA [Bacteroidales bacterium]|jgi:DNA repair protein RadA/Sms|nr:DNA repair protein RadA [Bacteroidales bacterium]
MAKVKTAFFCSDCGYESPKWVGKCPACGAWNTFTEEVIQRETSANSGFTNGNAGNFGTAQISANKPCLISDIVSETQPRIDTCDSELNRVLGGGLIPGSIILLGGEPGTGKSTLLLQIALQIKGKTVLYTSGEESEQQIHLRAERLGLTKAQCYILTETNISNIFLQAIEIKPDILIVDSIQTLYSDNIDSTSGSLSQIKECAAQLQRYAKGTGTAVFIIGHITKDGSLAGPKILEHVVDAVLLFEGDSNYEYRILRASKNRFGATGELGIYAMLSSGLRGVDNPSEILLSKRDEAASGTAIAATLEGLRPLMIEVQALVGKSTYAVPQRSATGFDLRRLNMLIAVLEKRCGFRLFGQDVFLNIAGGIKVNDPAIDLAVVAAILSSGKDVAFSCKNCFAAEVGLTGEIRPVQRVEQRIAEAEKLGFERIFISQYSSISSKCTDKTNINNNKTDSIEIIRIRNLFDLLKKLG